MEIRKVELAKEEKGCLFKDRVIIAISPRDAETIENTFEASARNERDYFRQGICREIKDFFAKVRQVWEKKRA